MSDKQELTVRELIQECEELNIQITVFVKNIYNHINTVLFESKTDDKEISGTICVRQELLEMRKRQKKSIETLKQIDCQLRKP